MKIRDIMVTDVIYVSPKTSISEVADILFRNRFHGVPVAEKGKLVGIITEDDFFLKNYDDMYLPSYIRFIKENKVVENLPEDTKNKIEKLLGVKAKDIMTNNCLVAHPDMEIPELMKLVKETKFTTFPITDSQNNLIGIVTLADILGTVRQGSIEMRKAFKGKFKNKETEELAKELDMIWGEKLVIVSRKRVRTWKGMALILAISAIGLAMLFYTMVSSRNNCDIEQKNVYPIECQKFIYSDWSECKANGTQTREALEKLPNSCAGGTPDVIRRCQ